MLPTKVSALGAFAITTSALALAVPTDNTQTLTSLRIGDHCTTTLTLNIYEILRYADNNPSYCEIKYRDLDLSRITALGYGGQNNCSMCVHVCGGAGCQYLMVVDQCYVTSNHLDVSTMAGWGVVGSDTGNWVVDVQVVGTEMGRGIWNGRLFADYTPKWGMLNQH
ncbi:hypothetical protein LTS18_003560 [Coniosporium uncinatum]|uniref:Uncharacterized protein n=1 Tax=Coniosporium uncinatum TaxID=93489 RepID=A0ACC3DT27_9PEZI|nr:hypothetical protein LTS18_003560 [Coniosporium uncinatum]